MDDLQAMFAAAVGRQITRIEAALAAHRAGVPGADESLRRLAYSAGGSGASCGFPEVTELAREAERAEGRHLIDSIERLLDSMRAMATPARPHTILIVDDDPLIARLLQMRLASPDRRILTCETLSEARRAIADHAPDLLVLDLFLPDGDGRTLLSELRSTEATARLPVVVVSASASPRAQCEALGATGYLHKPFDPDILSGLVSTLLVGSQPLDPLEGRAELMNAFRGLLASGARASVTSILPETHGPGGRRTEGPDPRVLATVVDTVRSSLPPRAVVAEWGEADAAIVADVADDVASALERARLRLRNHPHPSLPGAIVSFSAAVIEDDGGGGLVDAHARARQFALDANRDGGDRVVVPVGGPHARRVLLAEEDTTTAALIINRLEHEGFEVEHHPDAMSALDAGEHGGFGLVVIDTELRDGFEVLKRLRESDGLRDVPIVVLADARNERDVVRGFELGASDYILKPFSASELTTRLRRFTRQ